MASLDRNPSQLFRQDIEGLRGLAIALVMLCHARMPFASGGFVGVDVFFVVSGYLITRQLIGELDRTGRIALASFYARRIRRLLPAFAVALLLSAAAVINLVAIQDWPLQAASGLFAATWCSNFYFTFAGFDYFGQHAGDSVYLHTWSLAVEEQFYLIWPALLLILSRAGRAKAQGIRVATLATLTVVGGLSASIATSYWPVAAYYLMPTRIWQFAAGAILCFVPRRGRSLPLLLGQVIGSAGLLAIGLSTVLLDEGRAYPGGWAWLPTGGAMLLIYIGEQETDNLGTRLLRTRPLTFLGRVSYSLYLWHWPLLVLGVAATNGARALLFALVAVPLAWLSWAAIEQPIRRRPIVRPRKWILLGIGVSLLMAAGMFTWMQAGDSSEQRSRAQDARILRRIRTPELYANPKCDQWYRASEVVPCGGGDAPPGTATAILVGDSVGVAWYPALAKIFAERGWRMVVLTKSSCPIVDQAIYYETIRREYSECAVWREKVIDYVIAARPALVLVGSAGTYAFSDTQWFEGTRSVLTRLTSSGARVDLLLPTPILPFDGPRCLMRSGGDLRNNQLDSICTAPLADALAPVATASAALRRAVASVPQAQAVDLADVVCPATTCRAWLDDQLVYRDNQHINATFAESVSAQVGESIGSLRERSGQH